MASNTKQLRQPRRRKARRQTPWTSDVEKVGRGYPPKKTRFRKGVSGNMNGRPKGSKNLSTLLREAALGEVTATIGGKERTITALHAATLQLADKAARGDPRAMVKFIDWIDEIEHRAAAARPANFPFTPKDREILRESYRRMQACTDAKKAE